MSLPLEYPIIETGDRGCLLDAWRISGFSDSNTNRGRLYVSLTDAGGGMWTVSLYKDRDKTALVLEGAGAVQQRVTLAEQNTSGLSGSVYLNGGGPASTIVLYLALATPDDMRERDDRLDCMVLESPAETIPFSRAMTAVMRQFYLWLQKRFPPPTCGIDPLRSYGTGFSATEQGADGDQPSDAQWLWSLNVESDFEITGLQNPGDFREWAIYYGLQIIYQAQARAGEQDALFQRMLVWRDLADSLLATTRPMVDVDRDGIPERQVRPSSWTLRRG